MSSASDRTAQKRGLLYSNPNSADGWPIRSTVPNTTAAKFAKLSLTNLGFTELSLVDLSLPS